MLFPQKNNEQELAEQASFITGRSMGTMTQKIIGCDGKSPICRTGLMICTVALALGWGSGAAAAEDPYLKALQSEAGKVEDLTKAQEEHRKVKEAVAKQQVPAQPAAPAAVPVAATSGGSRADLEKTLRDQFPGTFALYLKFSEPDKQLVIKEFEASKASGIARYLPVINKVVQVSVARY
jgi:hypothetical protein